MKRAYISIAILLLLIIGSVINFNRLSRVSDNMLLHLENAFSSQSAAEMERATEEFEKSHSYLCSVTYHSEIDTIRRGFVLSRTYLSINDTDDFSAEIKELISTVDHLKENESFSLHNIF